MPLPPIVKRRPATRITDRSIISQHRLSDSDDGDIQDSDLDDELEEETPSDSIDGEESCDDDAAERELPNDDLGSHNTGTEDRVRSGNNHESGGESGSEGESKCGKFLTFFLAN
jgi:hypothetical protein